MNQLSDSSLAHSINEKGQVGGFLRTNGMNHHAVLWDNGTILDLGTLGGSRSEAYDINDAGKVVGYAFMSNEASHAFIWQNGKMFDLNNLLPPNSGWTLNSAKAINNNGQIVGSGVFNGQNRGFLLTPVTVTQ
jgi:probable HAF family extracellular repeat protein